MLTLAHRQCRQLSGVFACKSYAFGITSPVPLMNSVADCTEMKCIAAFGRSSSNYPAKQKPAGGCVES